MERITVNKIAYSYQTKYQTVYAVKDASCAFEEGKIYAITGQSGSGKSTLLSLLAGLDLPEKGDIFVDGINMREINRNIYRKSVVTVVYQAFHLLPLLTVEENVMLPMELNTAWRPDLLQWPEDTSRVFMTPFIVEVTPLESYLPDHPAEVQIERVLSKGIPHTYMQLEAGDVIFLCDHNNDTPEILSAGKTYIMCIREYYPHNLHFEINEPNEWRPETVVFSTQYSPDGTLMKDGIVTAYISEVTNGFYETEEGQRWLEYTYSMPNYSKTFPVLPTNGTNLLLPFYYNNVYIVGGDDITPDEYENGARVCLVS